ncbi:hypothetical protein B7R21_05035 [Subtercola boreus]|uniref:Htaa domain-containing protein n=1 Tax=Subtercola boreus TaxID=120213 RepID=A0A3E0VZA8_9MICO|nr:hypothetical protein [Subtercola boreus]RFA15382.1 hypothetical protein B7R21_05035 [Subtercola boreus]
MTPFIRRTVAVAAVAALTLGAALTATTSASAAPSQGSIDNASFTWGLSGEAGGGAFFGGCNFLSAGTAGNTGSSRLWTEADGFYAQSAGNVSIAKPTAAGSLAPTSWATKCQTPAGTAVSPSSATSLTGNVVQFGGGTGTVAADGSSSISWTGSFTVAFYGGLTYWTATNPTLSLDAAGNGQLTATASGYGTSMEDTSQWVPITGRQIVLADIAGAQATDTGVTTTPKYLGVAVTTPGTPQSTTPASWGSFPQSYIDFQNLTGQSSYWYSSGGSRDAAKPATPLAVSYAVTPVVAPPTDPTDPTGPTDPTTPPAEASRDISVIVPTVVVPEEGTFGWAFESDAAIALGTATQSGSSFVANGALTSIAVTDTRTGPSAYSWSISGQVGAFASGANTFGSEYLGWTPAVSNAGTGATAGSAVTSALTGGTGLATSATLASSSAAAGADIDADVSLVIPSSTPAGSYTSTLTITALS